MIAGPLPLTGRPAPVTLNGIPLMALPHTYTESEAERFGEKISIGEIRYQDFNPFENAESASRFNSGYGLQKYSDMDDTTAAHHWVKEATNFDGANGYGLPSGFQTTETLGGAGPIILLSEYTTADGATHFIAVTGATVFERAANGTWTDKNPGLTTIATCAAIFGNVLMIGYGGGGFAQWTSDLATMHTIVQSDGSGLNATAFTSDKASAYLGGGPSVFTQILSSLDGKVFLKPGITCIPPGTQFTGLAPGGGIGLVFFSFPAGLGMITLAGTVQMMVPFDWPDSQNGTGLGWVQGRGEDPQRGGLQLHFRRDNDPYLFQPGQTGTAGSAVNIAPWADPAIRPVTGVGVPTAWFGTARWLYMALTNPADSTTRIVRRDLRSGATSHYWSLGANACRAIAITGLFGSQPLLCVGSGSTNVLTTPLQRSGGSPLTDSACRYIFSCLVDLPDMDLGFPDEPKVEFSVRVEADQLAPGARSFQLYYASDGGPFTPLGTADQSPVTEILFTPPPSDRRLSLRAIGFCATPATPWILNGITVRRSINPALYRVWEFDAAVPGGGGLLGDDLQNPYAVRNALWAARIAGIPVAFVDQYGDVYAVRIMHLEWKQVAVALDRPPQEGLHVRLLQTAAAIPATPARAYTVATTGTAWPLAVPLPTVGLNSSYLTVSDTIPNPGTTTVYPTWQVLGPVDFVQLQNTTAGLSWSWSGHIGQNDQLLMNFAPTKQTVTNLALVDQSSGVVAGSTDWGLLPGDNSITVTIARGGVGSTVVILFPAG